MSDVGQLFTGFDGGGTKTKAVVIAADGAIIYETVGKASNVATFGVDVTLARLIDLLDEIDSAIPRYVTDAVATTFGIAGITESDCDARLRLTSALQDYLPNQRVQVVNDARIAWHAGHRGHSGIAIICGTGSACYGVDESGKVIVKGGMGHLISDDGSAYQIGLQGIRGAVRAHNGIGPQTVLSAIVQNEFSLQGIHEAPSRIQDRHEIAQFARAVYDAATSGDQLSIDIIERAATDLANMVKAVARSGRFDESSIRVAMVGGCFAGMQRLRSAFCSRLENSSPSFDIGPSQWSPERGAAEMARRMHTEQLA